MFPLEAFLYKILLDISNSSTWAILSLLLQGHSEKAMAPHSSTLAWKIPGTGEPGGLRSMGLHRVGHD